MFLESTSWKPYSLYNHLTVIALIVTLSFSVAALDLGDRLSITDPFRENFDFLLSEVTDFFGSEQYKHKKLEVLFERFC